MMKRRNKLALYQNDKDKIHAFNMARASGGYAITDGGGRVPLSQLTSDDVEFVAGRWCVQVDFPYEISMIRDRELILSDRIPHTERIPFEYYRAYRFGENCFGPFLVPSPDVVVAKYETDDGVYWGYGATIEQARAFLGIKLFDQYMDLIHATACRGAKNNQKK